jgi:hypothetical protein
MVVRRCAPDQFEKLAVGCLGWSDRPPGAVRPPQAERAQKSFSLLTNTSRRDEVDKVGLKVY